VKGVTRKNVMYNVDIVLYTIQQFFQMLTYRHCKTSMIIACVHSHR